MNQPSTRKDLCCRVRFTLCTDRISYTTLSKAIWYSIITILYCTHPPLHFPDISAKNPLLHTPYTQSWSTPQLAPVKPDWHSSLRQTGWANPVGMAQSSVFLHLAPGCPAAADDDDDFNPLSIMMIPFALTKSSSFVFNAGMMPSSFSSLSIVMVVS